MYRSQYVRKKFKAAHNLQRSPASGNHVVVSFSKCASFNSGRTGVEDEVDRDAARHSTNTAEPWFTNPYNELLVSTTFSKNPTSRSLGTFP